ncbi:NepR family anti-sigma factor [Salipiger abyssi]
MIDENLRRVYQDMLDEAVPDRFLDLIAQLRAQDEGSEPTGGESK